ncbi:MAG: hypothetical protein A2Y69_03190 [Candidatus Aminicenantes bacterium RBG_13_59_9]|nr:MAG: hypothetical protein A2Y69_03190 [Candidatus Aminicenantes bacterium RBG_13_59_9]
MTPPTAPRAAKIAAEMTRPTKNQAREGWPMPRSIISRQSPGIWEEYSANRSMRRWSSSAFMACKGTLITASTTAAITPVRTPMIAPSPAFRPAGKDLAAR